jgi:hypothetical protein
MSEGYAVYAALVTAGASVIGTVVTGFFTWRQHKRQKELEAYKTEQQKALSEGNALMGYQYDARKRLYTECEPIFFQLAEASEFALRKCHHLTWPRVWQELRPKRESFGSKSDPWMLSNSSELVSILYALYAPMALFCLLRDKMTTVDCSLDPSVWFRYRLARQLYMSFQEDAELAALDPPLEYEPLVADWRKKRLENPAKFWWQGLTQGRLDTAVRIFILENANGKRLLRFGEFETLYNEIYNGSDFNKQKALGTAANALYGFMPCDRPVFCRLLMVHIHLHHALNRSVPKNSAKLASSECDLKGYLQLSRYEPYDFTRESAELSHGGSECASSQIALNYLAARLATKPLELNPVQLEKHRPG